MSLVLEVPLMGLDDVFPDKLYILHHKPTMRYVCFCHEGTHGLACFSTEAGAIKLSEWINLPGMTTVELSFNEAREVAKTRPLPVRALILLDNINNPPVHYVK